MSNISFIIPTLKRPEHLRRCLKSVAEQTIPAEEILVGIRSDDVLSPAVLKEFADLPHVRAVEARGVGVVGSMNSCLSEARGDYVGLVDDDVELPDRWTEVMLEHLRCNSNCVAAGGRDILLDYPDMRRSESLKIDVGRFHFYGRVTGDHHRAGGLPRCVDALRGSNILWSGEFLRRVGFELELRGKGAQVNWEVALALQAIAEGRSMFFDPTLHVLHHVAPRHDDDSIHRGVFNAQGTEDIAFNETFVVLKHATGFRRLMMLIWQLTVGSPACPGIARVMEIFTSRRKNLLRRWIATANGRAAAAKRNRLSAFS